MKLERREVVEPGGTSSKKSKILTINVKRGWKEGTKITFPRDGDQVCCLVMCAYCDGVVVVVMVCVCVCVSVCLSVCVCEGRWGTHGACIAKMHLVRVRARQNVYFCLCSRMKTKKNA